MKTVQRPLLRLRNCLATLAVLAFVADASAASVTGTVVSVRDGNTFVLNAPNGQVTVKLKGIKAPVGRAKFAKSAKAQLAHLVLRQQVRVQFFGASSSRQVTGNAFVVGTTPPLSINRELVRRGFALADGPGALRGEERKAKGRKIGIHGPSLAPFLKAPAGWQVLGNADSIPFEATANHVRRKQILKALETVYAELDRLTLGRILFLSDPTIGFGGTIDVERSTRIDLARNKNFARRFRQVGGGSFTFEPDFNIDDTSFGTWKVVLKLNGPTNVQPILRLQETSGTDISGQAITPTVRQFGLEPDTAAAGRIFLNRDSFASGPL